MCVVRSRMRLMMRDGTVRHARQDSVFRRWASRLMNFLRERITRIQMTDQGCMLRAYSREIVQTINDCREVSTFIPALAYSFAKNPGEVEVSRVVLIASTMLRL